MSGIKEQGDRLKTLPQQAAQSEFVDKIFLFVVVRSFTADSNLLQPTGVCV